jgi:protein SCO1
MRTIRLVTWAAIVALVAAIAGLWATGRLPTKLSDVTATLRKLPLAAKFGGPFALTDQTGARFSSKRLDGKPFAIFFGFTLCPEVCPTSLLELTKDIESLGPDADKMNYLFVTVDPERDTPQNLKTYLENFDRRIIGLTGTPQEIADIARAYRVYFEKVKTKDGYTVNHTATIYLMGRQGQLVSTLAYGEKSDTRRRKLRALIEGSR